MELLFLLQILLETLFMIQMLYLFAKQSYIFIMLDSSADSFYLILYLYCTDIRLSGVQCSFPTLVKESDPL